MNKNKKSQKYDMLDCIELVEKCPKCKKEIKVRLTNFKNASFRYGLVWTCPHCYADFHIKKIELEDNN